MSTDRPDDAPVPRARAPLSDAERAEIVELVEAGVSRNEVARRVERSPSTVSQVAHSAGLSFDRSQTVAATQARQADNADKRSTLEALLLDDAMRIREQLWKPALVYNWSKDNDYAEHELSQPDFAGQNAIMRTVGVAIDKAKVLADQDRGRQDSGAVVSLLGALVDGLREEFGEDETDDVVSPEAE